MKNRLKWIGWIVFCCAAVWFAACEGPSQPEYGPKNQDPNPTGKTAASLTEVNPSEAYLKDIVTITGSGFDRTPRFNFVAFGTHTGTVVEASETELKVRAPNLSGEAVKIRVAVKGSEFWSNEIDFAFKNAVEIVDEEIVWPNGVDVDADGNVYVGSAADGMIYKITPEGEKSEFAEVPVNGAIRFGPEQYLYVCVKGESKIVRVAPDGSAVEDVVELDAEPVYFDWDANRNLYIVGNGVGLYRLDASGALTFQDSVANGKSCRVFGDRLYLTDIWDGRILRYDITPEGLANREVIFEGDSPAGVEFDAEGTMYYTLAWETSLYLLGADGSEGVMYDGELATPMRYLTAHGKFLYIVYPGWGDVGQVIRVYLGVEQAPNHGLT
jgi:sugar lactone lactonase YvrE